jgi:uncharacterized protein YbjT (DUF2867 family)
MILVLGGTGTLDTQLVRLLVDQGQEVRVLTRDPRRAADLPDTVQTLTGDLRDPTAIAAAVRECATVVSAVHGFADPGKPSPEAIDRDAHDVAAVAALAVHDRSLQGQVLEVAGPESLTFTQLAERLITASGRSGRIRHVPPWTRSSDGNHPCSHQTPAATPKIAAASSCRRPPRTRLPRVERPGTG